MEKLFFNDLSFPSLYLSESEQKQILNHQLETENYEHMIHHSKKGGSEKGPLIVFDPASTYPRRSPDFFIENLHKLNDELGLVKRLMSCKDFDYFNDLIKAISERGGSLGNCTWICSLIENNFDLIDTLSTRMIYELVHCDYPGREKMLNVLLEKLRDKWSLPANTGDSETQAVKHNNRMEFVLMLFEDLSSINPQRRFHAYKLVDHLLRAILGTLEFDSSQGLNLLWQHITRDIPLSSSEVVSTLKDSIISSLEIETHPESILKVIHFASETICSEQREHCVVSDCLYVQITLLNHT
jgi:hypothetical protein